MTLSQLKTFAAVCRHMSFTGAARELYLSQPAVSRQIGALEEELGLQLFVRARNTIFFTDAGQHLARRLVHLVEQMETVLGQAKQVSEGIIGQLYIGVLADQVVDPLIYDAFRQMGRPLAQLSVRRMDHLELERALQADEIDVAVSLEPSSHAFEGCRRLICRREALCLAVPKRLLPPDFSPGPTPEETELGCPILVPELASFPPAQYGELSQQRREGVREYEFASIVPLVEAGLTAAVVNESCQLSASPSVELFPLSGLPPIGKGFFWKPDNRNPVLHRLLELCGNRDRSMPNETGG